MPEPLKNMINELFFQNLTKALEKTVDGFKTEVFLNHIYDSDWGNRELKDRIRHVTLTVGRFTSKDYRKGLEQMLAALDCMTKAKDYKPGFELIVFPDFIEVYGLDDYQSSVEAIEKITQQVTCEFAVRPFIIRYEKQMMAQMQSWSKHPHPGVRRLSSEGSRPRLPWAMAIPALKQDPSPVLPILENLKNDESESVRKSVANNLNDISKDNPQVLLTIAKTWFGKSKEIDWIVKHACRTLLKSGNLEAMQLFGFNAVDDIKLSRMKVETPKVKMEGELEFSFQLTNESQSEVVVRVEYAIYFMKANGSLTKKVFKISERAYPPKSGTKVQRKHSFRSITTRKYYPGRHQVSVILNGKDSGTMDFELTN